MRCFLFSVSLSPSVVRVLSTYLVLSLCDFPCTRSRCDPSLASAPGGREGEVRARCVKWFSCRKFLRLTSSHFLLVISSEIRGGGGAKPV